jgi:hypothetical protein
MGSGVTTLLQTNSKRLWPIFPLHIGSYSISNAQHTRKEDETLQELIMCSGEPKGHDPHELAIIHVRSVSLTHPNIHIVDFEEDKFKGVLSYDEVLHQLPHDATKRELDLEQEEFKMETLAQFQKLCQQEKDTDNAKEQEKTQKEKHLEQKRLQAGARLSKKED